LALCPDVFTAEFDNVIKKIKVQIKRDFDGIKLKKASQNENTNLVEIFKADDSTIEYYKGKRNSTTLPLTEKDMLHLNSRIN